MKEIFVRAAENGVWEIVRGKKNRSVFETVAEAEVSKRILGERLNEVRVPKGCGVLENGEYVLIHPANGKFFTVVCSESLEGSGMRITRFLEKTLKWKAGETLVLARYRQKYSFCNSKVQLIDSIRSGEIHVAGRDSEGRKVETDLNFRFYRVVNTRNGCNFIIDANKIVVDTEANAGTVRLSRVQRGDLETEVPSELKPDEIRAATRANAGKSKVLELLHRFYEEGESDLECASGTEKNLLKEALKGVLKNEIVIVPVPESFCAKPLSGLSERLTRFYVGKSILSLKAIRPYETDENKNIVRISPSNMRLLGIEEMDRVILSYRNRRIRCKVLAIGDDECMRATNRSFHRERAVGVPVALRTALGVPDLVSAVKIERDTNYLFRKSIHQQIMPVLVTLLSSGIFLEMSQVWAAAASLAAVPVVSYFSLSETRNKRG